MTNTILSRSFVVNRIVFRMCSKLYYEESVSKLNLLQSNKSTIEQIRKDQRTGQKCTNLQDMEHYLSRIGVSMEQLDKLSVIHVAGTKGKGSSSAMCESILRHHGYRTGFFSSPHLVAVRERIRIDGRIVSERQFAEYFQQVYEALDTTKSCEGDMPKYFSFLTVMALHVFLREDVDVAVVEVGIGGIVDYTNVLREVSVVGITSLGLDHTSILGDTLPKIAAAKAGIMKPGCQAFTVCQPPEAMDVLVATAAAVKCPLTVVPDYKEYNFPQNKNPLLVELVAYQMNASLAMQMAHVWMQLNNKSKHVVNGQNGVTIKPVLNIPIETAVGLSECKWAGRYHVIDTDYARFYLDGAHTKESVEICADWFTNSDGCENKILIFSATGDRNAEVLLKPLKCVPFKAVYFVIPSAHKETKSNNDNFSRVEQAELTGRCLKHKDIWKNDSTTTTSVLECVSDALLNVKNNYTSGNKPSVLITGSLHLVGAALSILDPNLST